MLRKFSPGLICVVVVLAPLPFGSAEPFWGAAWCALLGVALIIAPTPTERRISAAIFLLLIVAVAWCGVVAMQYAPAGRLLPVGPGWNEASRLLHDHPLVPKFAVYGQIPIAAIVPPLSVILALLAGIVFGSEPTFTPRIYAWVATGGLAYAAYGIFAEVTNPTMLLWREKNAYLDTLTGTFVNHSTAATFFGSIAIIWYLRTLREVRQSLDMSRWRDVPYTFNKLKNLEFYKLGYALAFFLCLATTFMTRSRAGSLLTVTVLGLVTMLYFAREIKAGRRAVIGAGAFAVLVALAISAAGGPLTNELETRGVFDAGRAAAWRSALTIVRDHPWLGSGLGTFAGIFPAYRTPLGGVWGVWQYAHSTPIELVVEMGIPFATFIFALWSLMLWFLLRGISREGVNRIYVIAGAGVCALGTLHSFVDFSLQIPGFSIVCCALTGASLAAALSPPQNRKALQTQSPNRPLAITAGKAGGSKETVEE